MFALLDKELKDLEDPDLVHLLLDLDFYLTKVQEECVRRGI